MAEPASSQSNTKKLDQILHKLEYVITVDEWNNMATVLSEVSTDMKYTKEKVDRLMKDVIIGNGELPLKTQVRELRREVGENTEKLESHIEGEKELKKEATQKAEKKKEMTWARLFTLIFQITGAGSGILAAYLAYKLGLP